ncbi:hypothetical protein LTR65_000985 [Meristemomyces frigidus]
MAPATVAVFDTTELLEAILSQLKPIDLLRSQRVCERWRAVIQESDMLQRKLFLEALASDSVEFNGNPTSGGVSLDVRKCELCTVVKQDRVLNPFFGLVF